MKREITLIEIKDGWLWAERDITYTTLMAARNAIIKEDHRLAVINSTITSNMITYKPSTLEGSMLVDAITKK